MIEGRSLLSFNYISTMEATSDLVVFLKVDSNNLMAEKLWQEYGVVWVV